MKAKSAIASKHMGCSIFFPDPVGNYHGGRI